MDLSAIQFWRRPVQADLPGGARVFVPPAYKAHPVDAPLLAAYRKRRSTMAGATECDGMIAVGHAAAFESLRDFVQTGRGMLTTRWAYANESEGRWYGRPETFAETPGKGADGEELTGKLVVHTVGWRVYDDPGCLYAVNDRRGVMIGVWILNRHGGEPAARRHAARVAASFSPASAPSSPR